MTPTHATGLFFLGLAIVVIFLPYPTFSDSSTDRIEFWLTVAKNVSVLYMVFVFGYSLFIQVNWS